MSPALAGRFLTSELLEVKGSEIAQLCLTLCDPMDCSLPSSSVHGISQARILEWFAISFSRGIPNLGIKTAIAVTNNPKISVA